mgnify:CR=1 FL=1
MTIETNIQWEVTDTFCGEANYSWVQRGVIPKGTKEFSDLAAVRAVKKEIGWTGRRCKVSNYGDLIEIRPQGLLQVCFITFHYFGSAS